MIKVISFSILTLVKLNCVFVFFLNGYLGLMTHVTSPSTLDLFFFIGLAKSHDPDHGFDKLT